ncbi:hypothetical protein FA13DRAFT_643642 [Coprinellus micaceus]|uniref:Uncharacterized protein n=1 Tax=Coprinellus micaceus TaxID=71717 RepID=A0A4Y7T5Q3_COPMI|nr:hypothetical protein FA13DRAFT_643642 [Coprinellus micaceus]
MMPLHTLHSQHLLMHTHDLLCPLMHLTTCILAIIYTARCLECFVTYISSSRAPGSIILFSTSLFQYHQQI